MQGSTKVFLFMGYLLLDEVNFQLDFYIGICNQRATSHSSTGILQNYIEMNLTPPKENNDHVHTAPK
jgi:hypothetical protein